MTRKAGISNAVLRKDHRSKAAQSTKSSNPFAVLSDDYEAEDHLAGFAALPMANFRTHGSVGFLQCNTSRRRTGIAFYTEMIAQLQNLVESWDEIIAIVDNNNNGGSETGSDSMKDSALGCLDRTECDGAGESGSEADLKEDASDGAVTCEDLTFCMDPGMLDEL